MLNPKVSIRNTHSIPRALASPGGQEPPESPGGSGTLTLSPEPCRAWELGPQPAEGASELVVDWKFEQWVVRCLQIAEFFFPPEEKYLKCGDCRFSEKPISALLEQFS